MQAYGPDFARIYNLRWPNFARIVGPPILSFYAAASNGPAKNSVLDLCCGAGHLAEQFLSNGYRVMGLDLSESMLRWAQKNTIQYHESGQSQFVPADATDFKLDEKFGLVVSTYDSLNHLESEQALFKCFRSLFEVCDSFFIFDLNTERGLRNWAADRVDDSEDDLLIVNRGRFDEQQGRATMKITVFERLPDGLFKRFEETVFNSVFSLEKVSDALVDIGWKNVYFAALDDLAAPLAAPEDEVRVFAIASR
ncbi:MAG: class I SAM-dependent methyltransferase [bacterium]|nr:class I SAM-dependent methyltransferase [bacterium]